MWNVKTMQNLRRKNKKIYRYFYMYIESINIIFFSLIDNKGLIFLKIFVHLNLKWYFIILKKKKHLINKFKSFEFAIKCFSKLLPIHVYIKFTIHSGMKFFLSVHDVNTVFFKM